MQSGWLKEFFRPQRKDPKQTAESDGVSRRDMMKGGFVAGVAAGMAAGGVAATADRAEAQTFKNPPL